MLPYLSISLFVFLISLIDYKINKNLKYILKIIFLSIIVLFIGFRYEVGADWSSYLSHYNEMDGLNFLDILNKQEVGYMLLNYISWNFGLGINFVNFICALIFIYGIYNFIKTYPYFWLSIMILLYSIYVVGGGYTRQSVALGFVFFALSFWKESKLKYILCIFVAFIFHYTVLFMLIFYIISVKSRLIQFLYIFLIIFVLIILGDKYLYTKVSVYIFSDDYVSGGAMTRILLNLIPSLIYIYFYYKKQNNYKKQNDIWLNISFTNIFLFFSSFYFSLIADRLALYLVPIQIIGYFTLIDNVKSNLKPFIYFMISFLYFIVIIYWFNFATHAYSWIPYKVSVFK